MKRLWSVNADDHLAFRVLAGSDPMLQAFLTDRPSFTQASSVEVELSGFEWYVLNGRLSQIVSDPAFLGGFSFSADPSPTHSFTNAAKLKDAVNALSMNLASARESP